MVEPVALGVVLLFALVHCLEVAWPLLSGNLTGADLRVELVATLSETERGVPVRAICYVCAVGAGSFYATRQTLKTLPQTVPRLGRVVVGLGVLSYVIGSYAVIRYASGPIFPW